MATIAITRSSKLLGALVIFLGGLGAVALPLTELNPAPAQMPTSSQHMATQLEAETYTPAPGTTVRIAFRMKPERGWHGYWSNPGDSGLAPSVRWLLPDGMRASPLRHPSPSLLEVSGLASYVHKGSYELLANLQVPTSAKPGEKLAVSAVMDLLVCSDQSCVPETKKLTLDLTVTNWKMPAITNRRFDALEAKLPQQTTTPGKVNVAGGRLNLTVDLPHGIKPSSARLYPLSTDSFEAGAVQTVRLHNGQLLFSVPTQLTATPSTFSGVIGTSDASGSKSFAVSAKAAAAPAILVPSATEAMPDKLTAKTDPSIIASQKTGTNNITVSDRPILAEARHAGLLTLFIAFIGALLGGLILNLMPCVFPILSLKALSIARSGGTEATARREAVAYCVGAILVCVGLGGLLLGLRAAGSEAGWAFQLQDPRVILALLLLTLAIGFNLAGLFELRGFGFGQRLAKKEGAAGAFWTGTLAAFVATPCTGPFMGAALGAALLLPALGALLVFAGLGLGLALPFLVIGFVPAVRSRLPKPGLWMESFRRILALPMFVTAIGLAWVLGRQTGVDGMTLGLASAVALASGLWWLGRRQAVGAGRLWVIAVPIVIGIVAAMALLPNSTLSAAPISSLTSKVEPFSAARLAELRADNVPVFVDFTADWCLSCKVNDKLAIDTNRTQEAFRKAGVVTLIGDWTNGDPEITKFLASHQRNSIPYYLFYGAGKPAKILPQILSPGLLEATALSTIPSEVQFKPLGKNAILKLGHRAS